MQNRIYFKDNPWPAGHPIKCFFWSAEIKAGDIWFHFHLKTESYYSEFEYDESSDEAFEDASAWESPAVWENYHSCTLSTNKWHKGGFKVCKISDYSMDLLDGLTIEVDKNPENLDEWESLAFHIYLLGHDAVANHRIRFMRTEDDAFNIEWSGNIALAYAGDYDLNHEFKAFITAAKAPSVQSMP